MAESREAQLNVFGEYKNVFGQKWKLKVNVEKKQNEKFQINI
jgi:outer membrane receptor for ferric coprogen and ferric-rhodotorulic acid